VPVPEIDSSAKHDIDRYLREVVDEAYAAMVSSDLGVAAPPRAVSATNTTG
jgi:hypothetical protein